MKTISSAVNMSILEVNLVNLLVTLPEADDPFTKIT